MPVSRLENKKDKRLLVLFAFGFLILLPDLIPYTILRSVPDDTARQQHFSGRRQESIDVLVGKNTSGSTQRIAFFLARPMAINQASTQDLALLPGIGRTMAERIVQFREQNGGIHDVDDLERIPGIGMKTSHKISSFVTFTLQ